MIRFGTPADLPRLEEVSLAAFGAVTWQREVDRRFGPLHGLDWRERWRLRVQRALREQTFLVLEESGTIVGYACGTVDKAIGLGHLDIVAVDPAHQGQGYGRRLLEAIADWFRSEGAGYMTFESLTDNEGANALYRKEGFEVVASHYNWFKKIK
jgi:ribosomal protein S18 acetylase RimI-like enzyme